MRNPRRTRNQHAGRRGSAILFVLVLVVAVGGLSLSVMTTNLSRARAEKAQRDDLRAFYAAEAALAEGLFDLEQGGEGALGSEEAPLQMGGSRYFVEVEPLDATRTALRATGTAGQARSRMELVLERQTTGFYEWAAFGNEGLLMNSNSFTDSWHSGEGSYASQVPGGSTHARESGDIASNSDVIVMETNTWVWGNARPGPGGIVQDSAPQTRVSGSTAPAVESVVMPGIEVPSIPPSGSIDSSGAEVLGPGDVHKTSVVMRSGGELVIAGPARVVLGDVQLRSNSSLMIDTSLGPVEVYGTGDFELRSNSTVTTNAESAVDVKVYLTADNWEDGDDGSLIALNSNADFTGTIYAPDAYVMLGSNFEIFGSIAAAFVELSSNARVHFDEALLWEDEEESAPVYTTVCWTPLPPQ